MMTERNVGLNSGGTLSSRLREKVLKRAQSGNLDTRLSLVLLYLSTLSSLSSSAFSLLLPSLLFPPLSHIRTFLLSFYLSLSSSLSGHFPPGFLSFFFRHASFFLCLSFLLFMHPYLPSYPPFTHLFPVLLLSPFFFLLSFLILSFSLFVPFILPSFILYSLLLVLHPPSPHVSLLSSLPRPHFT